MSRVLFGLSLCAFAGSLFTQPAMADVSWGGPGWYLEYTETGFDDTLLSGPYAQQSDCESAKAANHDYDSDRAGLFCSYFNVNPN